MAKGISFDMATKDLQCGCGAIIWPLECFAMVFRRTDAHSINHDFRCLKCISAVMIDAAGPPE